MRTRRHPEDRKREILAAALQSAASHGFTKFTRDHVANLIGCSPSLIAVYFGTMPKLRRAVMREAVRAECLPVIGQGLAMGDPQALKADIGLKLRAALWVGDRVVARD